MIKTKKPAVEVEEEVKPVVKSKRTEATVVYRLGTRTYSEAEHGTSFEDMAKQFAAKHDGEIV